jgi:hypothetical protein
MNICAGVAPGSIFIQMPEIALRLPAIRSVKTTIAAEFRLRFADKNVDCSLVGAANFRSHVNANGTINATDVSTSPVKAKDWHGIALGNARAFSVAAPVFVQAAVGCRPLPRCSKEFPLFFRKGLTCGARPK